MTCSMVMGNSMSGSNFEILKGCAETGRRSPSLVVRPLHEYRHARTAGEITFLSRASATRNINLSSPSLVAMHAASETKIERALCFGSVMRAKITPRLSAFTKTPTMICAKSKAAPARHSLFTNRVPYPKVVCVATLKMSAALNPPLSKPPRHDFELCFTMSQNSANSKNVAKCRPTTSVARKNQCISMRLVNASWPSSFSQPRPRTLTMLRPASLPVATRDGTRHLRLCFSK